MKKIYFAAIALLFITTLASAQITLTQFSTGFTSPVDIKNCGDNRLFIVEQAGYIRIVDTAGVQFPNPFLDIRSRLTSGSERGLLGLAFDPNYKNNGYFFVYYTEANHGDVRISRFSVSATNPDSAVASSESIVITIWHPYSNHNGGHLAFGPDGYLYIGTGDGGSGNDPGNRAQNKDSLLGKMLRLDVSSAGYSIPPSNPWVGLGIGREEIWAYGHRNPWRWSFDRWNGDIWIGDVGQDAWEEVDYQPAGITGGRNYGWRCYEGLVHTSGVTSCSPPDTTQPVFVYAQAGGLCSVTGGYIYRGAKYADMWAKYFFSDYCVGDVKYLEANGTGGYNFTNLGNLSGAASNYSGFGEDMWGEMYAADLNGRIYKFAGTSCNPVAYLTDADTIFSCDSTPVMLHTPPGNGFHYTWNWSGGIIITDSSAIYATADGDYNVVVSDTNGCSATSTSVHVSFVQPPVVNFNGLDTLYCVYNPQVSLQPTPLGGTFTGNGISGIHFDPATAGLGTHTITYTYTDSHGCSNFISQNVTVDACLGLNENSFVNVSLFPNPNTGNFMLSFYSYADEMLNMEITDVLGQKVYSEDVYVNSGSHQINLAIPSIAKGIYSLKITDGKESEVKNFVVK